MEGVINHPIRTTLRHLEGENTLSPSCPRYEISSHDSAAYSPLQVVLGRSPDRRVPVLEGVFAFLAMLSPPKAVELTIRTFFVGYG